MANTAIDRLVNQEVVRKLTIWSDGKYYDLPSYNLRTIAGELPEGSFMCKVLTSSFKKEVSKLEAIITDSTELAKFDKLKFMIQLPDGRGTYCHIKTLGNKGLFSEVCRSIDTKYKTDLETRVFEENEYIDYKVLFENQEFMDEVFRRLDRVSGILDTMEIKVNSEREVPKWELNKPLTNIWQPEAIEKFVTEWKKKQTKLKEEAKLTLREELQMLKEKEKLRKEEEKASKLTAKETADLNRLRKLFK